MNSLTLVPYFYLTKPASLVEFATGKAQYTSNLLGIVNLRYGSLYRLLEFRIPRVYEQIEIK